MAAFITVVELVGTAPDRYAVNPPATPPAGLDGQVTEARYCSADNVSPGLNYPIPVPATGTNYSYWKSHCLGLYGSSAAASTYKWSQYSNVLWYSAGDPAWDGAKIEVAVRCNTAHGAWQTTASDGGNADANYSQATGTEGTTGNYWQDATNGHPQYRDHTPFFKVFFYDSVADSYTDETTDADSVDAAGDVLLPPQNATIQQNTATNPSDAIYFGSTFTFNSIKIDIYTAANVTGATFNWAYWNGTAWATLTVTDGTSGFTVDGSVTFTAPGDWATTTVNGVSAYWVKCYTTSPGTATAITITTAPLADQTIGKAVAVTVGSFTSTTTAIMVEAGPVTAPAADAWTFTKHLVTQCCVPTGTAYGEKPATTFTFQLDII